MDHLPCGPLPWVRGLEQARLALGGMHADYSHCVSASPGRKVYYSALCLTRPELSVCKETPNEPRAYTKASPIQGAQE